MIVIVAPYSPPDRPGGANLGGSRKLEIILAVLVHIDKNIVLVNSAHNDHDVTQLRSTRVVIGGVDVAEIVPPLSTRRTWGKLKNLFHIGKMIRAIQSAGSPSLFWFYNGYAFEMRLAIVARKRFGVPMILEFEDWHFSRKRGFNPKPYIDYFFWRRAARFMSGVFAVNSYLAEKMSMITGPVHLLPGVVSGKLTEITGSHIPFSNGQGPINVGYFGGLTTEKGADIVLEVAENLPVGFVLHVTGTGPLESAFNARASKYPGSLRFYGRVDEAELHQRIVECDVLLNPHSPIKHMQNGVFPFKVIEYIASGRLLVSTPLPGFGLDDILTGVQFVEHSCEAFVQAIINSKPHFMGNAEAIASGARAATDRFSEEALLEEVRHILRRNPVAG